MKSSKTLALLVVSLLALSLSYGVMATGYQHQPRRIKRITPVQQKVKRIRPVQQKVRMLRMWKLTEYLKLDEETGAKLFPILNRYDDQRLDLNEDRVVMLKEIKAELDKETPDDKKLGELLAKAEELRLQMEKVNQDERNELKNVLSLEQQAKLLLFYRNFDRDLYRMIRDRKTMQKPPSEPQHPMRPQPPSEPQRPMSPPEK